MARFDNGWFKFYRRAFFEDIGRNQTCLALWSALLSMATYRETKIIWQGKQRVLPPGSVVFGISELADKWEVSKATISRWLQYLASSERITVESGTRGTIVTILNWEQYQTKEDFDETPSEREVNANETPSEREVILIEEGKKVRKKNTSSLAAELPEIAKLWNEHAHSSLPRVRTMSRNSDRYRSAVARWSDVPDRDYWLSVIGRINQSDFCLGRTATKDGRTFTADIEFLCRPDTHSKVLEGKYDNRSTAAPSRLKLADPKAQRELDEFDKTLAEFAKEAKP